MIFRVDMSQQTHIERRWLALPPIATEQKPALWQPTGGLQKELLYPEFPIRKTIAYEQQIALHFRPGSDGEVRRWVERIVDRMAYPCAESVICLHHRPAATVGKDYVKSRDKPREWVIGPGFDALESRGCVDVPECAYPAASKIRYRLVQVFIQHSYAAGLDHYVRIARLFQRLIGSCGIGAINDHARIWRIINVTVVLPIEGIWLEKGHLMAALV